MNGLYDVAATALLGGTLDLVADSILVRGFEHFPFYAWNNTLSDLPVSSIPSLPDQPLIDRQTYNRALLASDITFPALAENSTLGSLVLYRQTDEMVIAYIDTRPDRMQIAVVGNGGPVTVAWANGIVVNL